MQPMGASVPMQTEIKPRLHMARELASVHNACFHHTSPLFYTYSKVADSSTPQKQMNASHCPFL